MEPLHLLSGTRAGLAPMLNSTGTVDWTFTCGFYIHPGFLTAWHFPDHSVVAEGSNRSAPADSEVALLLMTQPCKSCRITLVTPYSLKPSETCPDSSRQSTDNPPLIDMQGLHVKYFHVYVLKPPPKPKPPMSRTWSGGSSALWFAWLHFVQQHPTLSLP